MKTFFLAALVSLLVVFPCAHAKLIWGTRASNPRRDVVLLNFGDAELQITVLYRAVDPNPTPPLYLSPSSLYTVSDPTIEPAYNSFYNYTFTLSFSNTVGILDYTLHIGPEQLTATVIIAGFVIKSAGNIISGDAVQGPTVGQEGIFSYNVKAMGVDGTVPDLSSTIIVPRSSDGKVYMKELDEKRTAFSAQRFDLAISKFRVGRGAFLVSFEAPAIAYRGETFETVLHITQTITPPPPCVVHGVRLVSRSGLIEAAMYNLLTPPNASPIQKITLSVAGKSILFDAKRSSLVMPTSKVVFTHVSGTGSATIQCDGEDAIVVEHGVEATTPLTVVATGAKQPLAKDTLIKDLPSSTTKALISSVIRVLESNPSNLTKADAEDILDEYCSTLSASTCVVTDVTPGSTRLHLAALVRNEDAALKDLMDAFKKCTFQENTGYTCDKIELEGTRVLHASAATAAGSAGMATWTIIVVACVGGIGLVAVVVLSLWAVHRRSAQLSESEYSSSGPLGVPDPCDLLYEQSIVRDVYGRGEAGGPSMAEAIQNERVAVLREDVPQPPTSDGVSRRRSSDEVSSTYSM